MAPSRGRVLAAPPDGRPESALSAATALRTRTAPHHRATETAYSGYDLTEPRSYALFLSAHARAITAAERALAASPGLPPWRARTPFLHDDLGALNVPVPSPLPFSVVLDTGRAWGVLYVLEGSRIGSAMLSRQVPQGRPRSYLAASHDPGEWREFRARLDVGLATGEEPLLDRAVGGAIACFALFAAAARGPDPAEIGAGRADGAGARRPAAEATAASQRPGGRGAA